MLRIGVSGADKANPNLEEVPRRKSEGNLAWMRRAASKDGGGVHLLLVGGRDLHSFRLRVAQSHVRDDMTPSAWSHVALFRKLSSGVAGTQLYEISLDPPGGFRHAEAENGLQRGQLRAYDDRAKYPNIAVIKVPLQWSVVERHIKSFAKQRRVLDANELVLMWLAFVWGVGATGNPLLAGHGVPSAALAEVVFSAAGYDITPGLDSQSSCPESIWQAVKWWHPYYEGHDQPVPSGVYVRDHVLPGHRNGD